MTKEQIKAKELVDKYLNLGFSLYVAIQCALIAVDEILDLGYSNKSDFKVYDFYSKVKQEILKL